MISQLLLQPVRPFPTTQPVIFQIKLGRLHKLFSMKPLSTLLFHSEKLRDRFTNRLVNERVVEVPFVFQHLPNKLKARILDIGCCESTLSLSLASLGYQTTGVDMRPYELTHPNLSFIQGDMCEIQLKDNFYETVISLSTLEHIGLESIYGSPASTKTSDREVIAVVKRVLKPGGTFLLTVPCASQAYKDQFMRAYTPIQLTKMLKGFETVTTQFYKSDRDRTIWSKCEPEQLDAYPNFGVALIKAVKKN